jgi:4-hydroxymandelate oxidase
MADPVNIFEFEALARARVEANAWDYITGGAEDEITLLENRRAFERTFLRPRYLVDVTARDLTTTVLGTPIPFPLLLAPTGYQMLSHPEGEVETARGAGAAGIPMLLSTVATRTMEDVAEAATGPLWFQLYMMQDMAVNEWLVRRAERNGFRAIVLTVDAALTGNRERDRRNQLSFAQVNVQNLLARTQDAPPNIIAATHYGDLPWKQDLSWRDVEWLRAKTRLPVVIKGLLTAEDARLAVEHGAAGIVVSNHGGRQLDGAPATLDVLPEIADAVGASAQVFLDGGVRRGADILKAVALGARAVCIGRPYLWGLAADGARGVQRVIEILRYEFDMAMALTGKRSVAELDRSVIWRNF